jgi:hypothetical protein
VQFTHRIHGQQTGDDVMTHKMTGDIETTYTSS